MLFFDKNLSIGDFIALAASESDDEMPQELTFSNSKVAAEKEEKLQFAAKTEFKEAKELKVAYADEKRRLENLFSNNLKCNDYSPGASRRRSARSYLLMCYNLHPHTLQGMLMLLLHRLQNFLVSIVA